MGPLLLEKCWGSEHFSLPLGEAVPVGPLRLGDLWERAWFSVYETSVLSNEAGYRALENRSGICKGGIDAQ